MTIVLHFINKLDISNIKTGLLGTTSVLKSAQILKIEYPSIVIAV